MASPRTYAVLAALAALICGFSLLRGIDAFDEGLILQAADRIADGQLPYRDYLYPYGPGQPFLLAGLQELFGPSLLVWRIVRLLVDVAVSLVVFELVRRVAPLSARTARVAHGGDRDGPAAQREPVPARAALRPAGGRGRDVRATRAGAPPRSPAS